MKYYLIVILSTLIFPCYSQKIEVKLINGYNNELVTDFKLNFVNKDGEVVDSQTSNENGIVTHKLKESVKVIEDEKMKYFKTLPLSISARISNKPILHYFYPTKEAEKKILKWEKEHIGKHVPDFSVLDEIDKKEKPKDDLSEDIVADDTLSKEKSKKVIIDYPDKEAQFPNGDDNMKNFIAQNILYPEISMELGDQGKVFIEFVVEKNGLITQVKVLRGVSDEIDAESIRVVRSMPKWKPAESAGELVRARCRMPINYVLQ